MFGLLVNTLRAPRDLPLNILNTVLRFPLILTLGAFHIFLFSAILFPEVASLLLLLPGNYITNYIRLFAKEVYWFRRVVSEWRGLECSLEWFKKRRKRPAKGEGRKARQGKQSVRRGLSINIMLLESFLETVSNTHFRVAPLGAPHGHPMGTWGVHSEHKLKVMMIFP